MFGATYSLEKHQAPPSGESFFEGGNLRAVRARDEEELVSALQQFAASNGFERYSLLVADLAHEDGMRLKTVDNTPSEFLDASRDEKQRSRDPVFNAYKRLSEPFTYGPETYTEYGATDLWDEQAEHGYCYGIVSPFHLLDNRHVIVGVDRYDPLPLDPSELTRIVSAFHLFATFVQCAARGLLLEPSSEPQHPIAIRLSLRERECLQWAAAGKTAWETGMILSIAEGSVAKLIGAATRKLQCVSKTQALVKALKLGLIH